MKRIHTLTDTKLRTQLLILRYPKADDAPEIFSLVQSQKFPEQLPLKEMDSLSKIEAWLKRLRELWNEGQVFSWITEDGNSGQLLGQVTLSKVEDGPKWSLAFWVHPEYWGKGYATEAAERIMSFGFEELGAKKIWAAAGKWNQGSNRVLEKLGMNYLGDNPSGELARYR